MDDFKEITPETGASIDSLGQKTTLSRLKGALKTHITIDNDWSAAIKIKKQADPVVRALMQHDPHIFPPSSQSPLITLKKLSSYSSALAKTLIKNLKTMLKPTPSTTPTLKDDPVISALLEHDPALHPSALPKKRTNPTPLFAPLSPALPKEKIKKIESRLQNLRSSLKESAQDPPAKSPLSRPSTYPGRGKSRHDSLIKRLLRKAKSAINSHIHIDNDRRTPLKLKKAGQDPIISALEHHEPHTHPFGKTHTAPKPITSSFSAQANPKKTQYPRKTCKTPHSLIHHPTLRY